MSSMWTTWALSIQMLICSVSMMMMMVISTCRCMPLNRTVRTSLARGCHYSSFSSSSSLCIDCSCHILSSWVSWTYCSGTGISYSCYYCTWACISILLFSTKSFHQVRWNLWLLLLSLLWLFLWVLSRIWPSPTVSRWSGVLAPIFPWLSSLTACFNNLPEIHKTDTEYNITVNYLL